MASDRNGMSKIGRGVVVRGTIRGEGDLTIEGRVEGLLDIGGEVEITETARLRSPVSGERVIVRGAVAGDIRARESIVLEEGARVVGDLGAPSVGIRPGGLLRGYVSTAGKAATAAASAKVSRSAPIATPAPRAQRPAALPRVREEVVTPPAPSQRTPARQVAPARPAVPSPAPSSRAFVEPVASPMIRASGKPTAAASRESSSGPPPPVVPALKKGARGSMKKKAGR